MVTSPVGFGMKNLCDGEGQQQFSSKSVRGYEVSSEMRIL
jgi:hypothetical protein